MSTHTTGRLRADSARVRERMLTVARDRLRDGDRDLPLNAIAKAAGVGVGTAYRHFPTRQALIEALAAENLTRLAADARASADDTDPAAGFQRLVATGLRLLRADPALAEVLATGDDLTGDSVAPSAEFHDALGRVLKRARQAGTVRSDITADDLRNLMCGVQHAAAVSADDVVDRYLDVLFRGLRA
ncbi:helix-turn-helix domain containing protein [Micromonospora sp. WMMD1128]|uniref:TetR/AcrR family transcriptional regulator n=1 Tax=unclassified Micromonospora TaxID=2617518 RepID=UPI00248B5DF2|nr:MULTISPECIES: TetR/AcrR family transcriptional regulator [unclassified Micromonospora]WBB73353.1 helix-turn-helix domain containing protein [Micromonospora sp. WMMD1128]WFE33242.1 helix-turn-helix domain containing protein [Micromonospora sp. WMMD975]